MCQNLYSKLLCLYLCQTANRHNFDAIKKSYIVRWQGYMYMMDKYIKLIITNHYLQKIYF